MLLFSAKVLVVVDEIWQPSLAVDDITSLTDGVGQGAWTTAEHSHLAHLKAQLEHTVSFFYLKTLVFGYLAASQRDATQYPINNY